MKKIFLSLSAIALLAVGTVSCGGDDSSTPPVVNPTDDTPGTGDDTVPGEAQGAFVYDGQQYDLTNMHFLVNGSQSAGIQLINVGTEAEPVIVSRWVALAYNSTPEDVANATHYYQFSFDLPTEEGTNAAGETTYALLFPNEVEPTDFTIRGVYAEYNLQPLNLGTIAAAGISFETFQYGENVESLTTNSSVFGADANSVTIGHEFDGEFVGIGFSNLNQSGKVNGALKIGKVDFKQVSEIKKMKYTIAK
ncbi:hypothetical protein EG240_01060 [Paenimyroides tangerinum]|uniref:Transferrin-binding protein B C-lobe/N-lobe beta barrel domain-containing protein n=1 Tax=Paenimyroides tangerinum TaxID=2488728 RepID=A0A3P3WD57_9FLAO|nr:hypothetical protein [Paenimyroides tangerinum]RRJ93095.1 hypothetical protein EG240_01060 [Paenimyroides tangerinum]